MGQVVMVSNYRSERSFSKLKLIKNRLRTFMCNNRLSQLTLMSIEVNILRDLNFEGILTDFAKKKARKVSLLKNLSMTSRVYFNHVVNMRNKSKFFFWLVGSLNLWSPLCHGKPCPCLNSDLLL